MVNTYRAILRWAWKSTLRDLRQYLLMILLVSVSVSLTITAAIFIEQTPVPVEARYGTATHQLFIYDGVEDEIEVTADRETVIEDAAETFNKIQTVQHSYGVSFVGGMHPYAKDGTEGTEYGGNEPRVIQGRLPTGADEIAISPLIATGFEDRGLPSGLGDTVAWDRQDLEIVGVVEDPNNIHSEAVLVAEGTIGKPEVTNIIVETTAEEVANFEEKWPWVIGVDLYATDAKTQFSLAIVFLTAFLAMTIIGLLCSAGFYVMHGRRAKQNAVVHSLGATEKQLRQVMVLIGTLVGSIGSIIGLLAGLTIFFAGQPYIRNVVGHDVSVFDTPIWLLLPTPALAISMTTLASLAPARTIAKQSIRSVFVAAPDRKLLTPIIVGSAFMTAALIAISTNGLFTLPAGVGLLIIGILTMIPLSIHSIKQTSSRFKILWRIVGSDLSHHRSKTVASIAALTMVGALTMGVALTASAVDTHQNSQPENLPRNMALLTPNPDFGTPEEKLAEVVSAISNAELVPIYAPYETGSEEPLYLEQPEVGVFSHGKQVTNLGHTWIATPELLETFGVSGEEARSETEVLTIDPSPVAVTGEAKPLDSRPLQLEEYSTIPTTWILREAADTRNYEIRTFGWLVVTPEPMTIVQQQSLYSAAGRSIDVLPYLPGDALAPIGGSSLLLGSVVSIGMAMVIVMMLRSESSRDFATLTAVGAPANSLRTLTARSSFVLLMVASLLATPIAYFLLQAVVGGSGKFSAAINPSVFAVYLVVVPLAGAGIGYLLGNQKTVTHRRLLD